MGKISGYDPDTVLDDADYLVGVDSITGKTKRFLGSVIRAGMATAADVLSAKSRANHTGSQTASTISDFSAAADARITAQKGQPSGIATLDGSGFLSVAQIPSLAISDTFVVASQSAMLALTAQAGDIAIRTDSGKTYILSTSSPTTLGDWKEILASGGGGGTGDMVLGSAQENTGAKTFDIGTLLDKGSMVFNVKAFGALGNDTADDTTAIQNAIVAAAAVGGIVWLPAGVYKLTAALKLYTGTTPTITAYSNITIAGAGASGAGGSILKQYTTGLDCIKGLNDAANAAQSLNCNFQDFCMLWGTGTATNSGNGIYLAQQSAGGPSFQQFNFKNVVASGFQGSGKLGFNIESLIVSTLNTCMAVSCANGFWLNGAAGGNYNSVSTSVTFINCYANMSTNGVNGYRVTDDTYVSFVGCAADVGANIAGTMYLVEGSNCVTFQGCGTELDGTHTLSNMWKIAADSGSNPSLQVILQGCYGFQGKSGVDVYVTGASQATVSGFQDNSSVSGATGLKIDAGSTVHEEDCSWGGAATQRTIASTAIWLTQAGVPRIGTVASSATPSINVGATDVYTITALTVPITGVTITGTPVDGQRLVVAITGTASRAVIWGGNFEASTVALPTTTSSTARLDAEFMWNAATSKFRCIRVS